MGQKTNKSYTKRLKKTRTGKLVSRPIGQDHFNAKVPGRSRLARKRTNTFEMPNKARDRFLAN